MKSDTDRSIDKGSVNLRESVKATGIWQEQFNVCRALSDGRCGAHCIALHIYNDQNREKEVMNKLNKHMLENWEHFKYHFSFPYSHSIGIGNTDKVFQNETHLKNFIQIDQNALNMWMDHPWLQAAANIYNINIQILTTGIEIPRWTKLQPTLQLKGVTINQNIKDIYLLHANDSHFDLLVPKENSKSLVLTEEEQEWIENQINLVERESRPSEIEVLISELAESKKEIKELKVLVKEYASQAKLNHVNVKKHDKQHEVTIEKNICGECGQAFSSFTNLELHVSHEHQRNKSFDCTTCQKKYSTKENLWSHISDEHKKMFNCDSCEETFHSEKALNNHSYSDHNIEYNCDQCHHQDTTKRSLDNHIKLKHTTSTMDCKGVGSKKCGQKFESYSDLMDHKRDQHNSGNKICRYFKEGTCFYMNGENGGCWYLHINATTSTKNHSINDIFPCTNCDNTFKSLNEVMKHRLQHHEEEVPECSSIKEGKKCVKNTRCWFRHPKTLEKGLPPNVHLQAALSPENFSTNRNTGLGFWPVLPDPNPPNQIEKMMEMLKSVMKEVSGLKLKLNQN